MSDLEYRNHALPENLVKALESLGFERLTPIQALSFPVLRAGKDLIGESRTGSGKTLAFGIPLLEKVNTRERTLQALVLCPTRELVEQVARTLRGAGRFKSDLLICTLVGGQPLYLQLRSLRHGVHVVVGTPGRLLDLIDRGKIEFSKVRTVVLDEADRMLDMGFRDAIELILGKTPPTRQTALFSATFPPTIEALSARYQKNPERVRVEVLASERPDIEQRFYRVDEGSRLGAMTRLLRATSFESALVFCNLKTSVDELHRALKEAEVRADKIHGDLEQAERDRVMARFRNGTARVLIATDVAARGLDIEGLDAVFNFELAASSDTHTHRIGRTGRAGKKGLAISLFGDRERSKIQRIEEAMGLEIPVFDLVSVPGSRAKESCGLETIEISGGRRDKLRPGDILGALTGEAGGLPGSKIGKIEIRDHNSYVAVHADVSRRALQSLQQGKIKGRRFSVWLVSV